MKKTLPAAITTNAASHTRGNKAANPLQLLQQKHSAANPFLQTQKQTTFNPVQLLARNAASYRPVPTAQLAKLPNLERAGPEYYIKDGSANAAFKRNHWVNTDSDFTTTEARQRGLARTERKNSLVKMDDDDLKNELKKIITTDVKNEDFTAGNPILGKTTKAYPFITSVKGRGNAVTYEGGESILTLGLAKHSDRFLWINHLDSAPLKNHPTWIAARIAAEAAAAAEAARLAAAEQARLQAEAAAADKATRDAAKKRAKNQKKYAKKKAAKDTAPTPASESGEEKQENDD